MTLNQVQFAQVVETAKAAAASSPAWVRAITKAADVLLSNPYVELMDNGDVLMVSETSSQIYTVNGKCEGEDGQPCKGYQYNKGVCYHRALKQLVIRYREAEAAQPAASRESLIADIKTTWRAKYPTDNLADELMRRFRRNQLEMLSVDFLTAIRAAIA